MPDGHASLDSIDLLKDLRAAIINFSEESRVALGEAEAEINRTINLIHQAEPHWKGVIRNLQEQLAQAKDQLRQKNLYPTAGGGRQSVVDEKKLVAMLQRKLEEAEARLRAVERWRRQIETEAMQYRGMAQPIARIAEQDAPRAVALLDRMADALDQYLAVTAPGDATGPAEGEADASMKRAETEQETPEESEAPEALDDTPAEEGER